MARRVVILGEANPAVAVECPPGPIFKAQTLAFARGAGHLSITTEHLDQLLAMPGAPVRLLDYDEARGGIVEEVPASGIAYTFGELRDAFHKVANRFNWKEEVAGFCTDAERDLVKAAVVFFTGSVPTFTRVGPNRNHVSAAGYYATVGA